MNAQQTPPASGGDTGKLQLAFLAKLSVAVVCVGMIWLLKTLIDAAFILATDDITKVDWQATARWIVMSVGVLVVIAIGWSWGARKGLWSPPPRLRKSGGSASYSGDRVERRFSLGAAVWILVGLALATLLALLAWHEFEFGLSNAPERMALRGYVPRESVASALAAAAPALPEVRTVIAPALGANGEMKWSEEVIRREDRWFYIHVPDSLTNWVERRVDGVIVPFGTSVNGRRNEFRSLTNYPVEIRWITPSRRLTAEERTAMN